MGLSKFLLAGLLLGARCDELEFEDDDEEKKDGSFPSTFEELIWNAPAINVTTLTSANFDEVIGEKVAFINFCAGYMTSCKLLYTDWALLWKDNEINEEGIVVASVDCHTDQALCDRYGITALPTLLYGGVGESEMVPYEEGRGIDALRLFVEFGLKHPCTPTNVEHCTVEQQIDLARYVTMDEDDLDAFQEKIDMKIQNIGVDYGAKMWTLQQQYQGAIKMKEKKVKKAVQSMYGVMLEVRRVRDEAGEHFPALEAARNKEVETSNSLDALLGHKKNMEEMKKKALAEGKPWPPPEMQEKIQAAMDKLKKEEAEKAALEIDGTTK